MKVAINILPLKSAHKLRGIGYYTSSLLKALKQDNSIKIQQFISLSEIKDADVIHYPWFDLFFHTLPITRNWPTVVTVHDVIPLVFPKSYPVGIRGKINFVLQKIALNSCRYIVADSKASEEDIIKHLKIKAKKITVVPLAADENFKVLKDDATLLHIKRKYHLPDRFLLYVGDANWVKNLPFLIEGFRRLLELSDLSDIKLVLVGGVFLKNVETISHPELESLKLVSKLIKQYSLEAKVVRPGQIEDDELVVFYNLATVYIQPSFYEGFGLPVLEAFACGIPVMSSDRGSLVEVGGNATVYFDPFDINQFIRVAHEILQSRSMQSKLSRLGLAQAAKFSWKKVADQMKSVYLKTIDHE